MSGSKPTQQIVPPEEDAVPSVASAHDLTTIYRSESLGCQSEFSLDLSIGYQIRTAHRMLQRYLQSKIEPHGVTLGMWYFLRVLWQQDGVTQSDLSRSIGTMEPTTMTAIASMERIGLVRRERDPTDARRRLVFLTERGQALREELVPLSIEVVQHASDGLTLRELAMLLELLKVIQANLHARIAGATDVPD